MPFVLNKTRGLSENWLLLIIGVISISASLILDNRGFPQKWHAAIMWTGVAFGTTILSSHKKLNSWRSWMVWFSLFFFAYFADVVCIFDTFIQGSGFWNVVCDTFGFCGGACGDRGHATELLRP